MPYNHTVDYCKPQFIVKLRDWYDYNVRYEALVSQYEATKAERDRVAAEIRQKGIRRREFERFITTLEKLPEAVMTFEESMWSSLVDYVTVSGKDDLQFTLACGVEIKA